MSFVLSILPFMLVKDQSRQTEQAVLCFIFHDTMAQGPMLLVVNMSVSVFLLHWLERCCIRDCYCAYHRSASICWLLLSSLHPTNNSQINGKN